jgi:hypothetical protein
MKKNAVQMTMPMIPAIGTTILTNVGTATMTSPTTTTTYVHTHLHAQQTTYESVQTHTDVNDVNPPHLGSTVTHKTAQTETEPIEKKSNSNEKDDQEPRDEFERELALKQKERRVRIRSPSRLSIARAAEQLRQMMDASDIGTESLTSEKDESQLDTSDISDVPSSLRQMVAGIYSLST